MLHLPSATLVMLFTATAALHLPAPRCGTRYPVPRSGPVVAGLIDDILKGAAGKDNERNPFKDESKAPLSSGARPWYMPQKEEKGEYWKPGDDPSWQGALDGFLQGLNFNAQLMEERQEERRLAELAALEAEEAADTTGGSEEAGPWA